jgi:hypothetical protein
MSFLGLKSGVQKLRYMPQYPTKYGPLLNVKSLSSLNSNKNTKKTLTRKEGGDLPFDKGFLDLINPT